MKDKGFIIGVTGAFGSGKSVAASFFEEKDFRKIVLSTFLEEEAKRRKVGKITRKILQDIGNEWRRIYGSSILAKKALELVDKGEIKKVVIDGIRNIGEIDKFRKQKNFILLSIIADRKIRFNRLKKLERREKLTWSIFEKLDRRDLGLGQKKAGLQVALCLSLGDVFIDNNNGMEEFKNKLEEFLKQHGL